MTSDNSFVPEPDTNLGILIDYQIMNRERIEILTSEDNLMMIAITKRGLQCFSKMNKDIQSRIDSGEIEGIEQSLICHADFAKFMNSIDDLSYFFRFTSSSFSSMPPQLLTFTFDILKTSNQSFTASIYGENHPIIALFKALTDLSITLIDVIGLAITVEYCGEIVFKSPNSLMKAVFKGKTS